MKEFQSSGRVINPNDPGYAEARQGWNARFDRHPDRIVYCQNAQEVSAALLHALDRRMPVRARCGGHSFEGFSSVDEGLLIDVTDLSTISVNKDRTVAVVGSGVRLGDIYTKLAEVGTTVPAGTCPSVGIAGLTLGGGVGMLSRSLGLLVDSLLGVEIVDARGRILTADAHNNPDLFWACRGGGGGNFGIVTSLRFRVAPISYVTIFSIAWRWTDFTTALDGWQRWAPDGDERISSILILPARAADIVIAFGQFVGTAEELRPLLEPLTRAGSPTRLTVETMPYIQAVNTIATLEGPATTATSIRAKSTMTFATHPFDEQAVQTLKERLAKAPVTTASAIYAMGGAIDRVAPDETAFVHRRVRMAIEFQAYWINQEDDQENISWVTGTRQAMRPYTTGGANVNNPDLSLEDYPRAYYGDNLTRLVEVKRRYDPEDVFNHPQSVPVSLTPDEA